MSVEEPAKRPTFSHVKETAAEARNIVRAALKGSLASALQPSGHPYASLLLTATEPDGAPVLLISKLALHTKNLAGDARASLLIDGTGTDADPMAGARITLIGEARPTTSATARRRFLARHPAAAGYADFPDFSFYAFDIASAHFIGGFGRIVDLQARRAADRRRRRRGADRARDGHRRAHERGPRRRRRALRNASARCSSRAHGA